MPLLTQLLAFLEQITNISSLVQLVLEVLTLLGFNIAT